MEAAINNADVIFYGGRVTDVIVPERLQPEIEAARTFLTPGYKAEISKIHTNDKTATQIDFATTPNSLTVEDIAVSQETSNKLQNHQGFDPKTQQNLRSAVRAYTHGLKPGVIGDEVSHGAHLTGAQKAAVKAATHGVSGVKVGGPSTSHVASVTGKPRSSGKAGPGI